MHLTAADLRILIQKFGAYGIYKARTAPWGVSHLLQDIRSFSAPSAALPSASVRSS